MIQVINTLMKTTGKNWHSIMMHLKSVDLISPSEIKEVEEYFFDLEDKGDTRALW